MMLPTPRSLFARLLLGQIAIIAAVAVALPMLLGQMLHDTADGFIAGRLAHEAALIAAGRPDAPAHGWAGRNGRVTAVFAADGRVVRSRPAARLPFTLAETAHGDAAMFDTHGPYDILTRPIALPGGARGWIAVAQDRTHPEEIVDDVVRSFLRRFVWVIVVALAASLILSLLVVRHVTGSFRRAAAEADGIGLRRLDRRIDPARMPSEAQPLVRATNRALERLETGFKAQGEFVGNVAHELRTPLALISLRLEQMDPSPQRDEVQAGVQAANHVIHQLMELAAIDRAYPALEMVDPCVLARDAVEQMAPIVYGSDHSIAFEAPATPPPMVRGVRELMLIALTNLIDNAVRHTPPGSTITVSVAGDGAVLVEDDGPGLAVDARDPQRRRFRRGDTARSDSAGLGLSIVERIMAACGGGLETGQSAAGGALLRLRFDPQPLASA